MNLRNFRLDSAVLCLILGCGGSDPEPPPPIWGDGDGDSHAGDGDGDGDASGDGDGDGNGDASGDGDGDGDASGDGDGDGDVGGDGDGDGGVAGDGDGDGDGDEPFEGEGDPWLEPAPRATCAAGDMPDTDLQGISGAYRCNLQVAGQVDAPHFLSLAWYQDCAYVNGSDGTTVIQVSEAGTPMVTTTLTEIGFRSNWESMKANAESSLLAGYESNGAVLAVYDLAEDCAHPALQSSTMLAGGLGTSIGHAGSFSPDGTIYYASSMYTSEIFAVDLANPKTPTVITSNFERGAHDLFIGKNGTRGYFAYSTLTALGVGSFAIMDLTQVQARAANATGTLIKEIQWEDGNVSQYPIAITYRGKDYLMITDELGSGACGDPAKPQWGYARIFDISDEQNPALVSLIKTEAQDPAHCEAAGEAQGGTSGFGLGTHYCNVDRLDDPRLLSCGNWDGGVRVYDIRNPWRPKEVAYFDTADADVPGLTRIHVEKRELWVATTPGTFYVLKFPAGSPVDAILSGTAE